MIKAHGGEITVNTVEGEARSDGICGSIADLALKERDVKASGNAR